MIRFEPMTSLPPGGILSALEQIYAPFQRIDAARCREWRKDWEAYDSLLSQQPETVGRCGFITIYRDQFAGFCSWDPRGGATRIVVGHNGILPSFRGLGLGKLQIEEMLRRFREQGFRKTSVTTGSEEYFAAARRMYESCGFVRNGEDEEQRLVFYGLDL